MSSIKHVSLLMGLAAALAGAALPAQASVEAAQDIHTALESEAVGITFDASLNLPAVELAQVQSEALAPAAEPAATELAQVQFAQVVEPQAEPATAAAAEPVDADVATSASLLLEPAAVAPAEQALAFSPVETTPATEQPLLAQTTRDAYQGISPAYLGIGGNIGLGDSSPLADLGFAVISKISLGPRFALRPGALFAEKGISFPVPITYNFNTLDFSGFTVQPYIGAGVDIPTVGGVGLLANAGVDVPISRDFTFNATTNFRLTDGFGFGLVLGIAYNFPWIFE
jgi:hypothetical protein